MQSNSVIQLEYLLPRFIELITGLEIHLTFGTDFAEFKELCRKTDEKSDVGPAFDVDEIPQEELNGFWLIGRRPDGAVVHTQAIKLLCLNETTFQQHLRHHSTDFRIGGIDIDIAKSIWKLTPSAQSINGRVTYHGELWLKGGADGIRGGCAATLLTRLMLIIALMKWSPHFLIGIQAAGVSCRGLATREGYMRTEQGSILWERSGGGTPIEGWLVWMKREEAMFNLQIPPDRFFNMLETPKVSSVSAVPLAMLQRSSASSRYGRRP